MGDTKRSAATGKDGNAAGDERARRGNWVEVHSILLSPNERSTSVPEDTKKVPMEMWVRGFLLEEEAGIGEEVEVETAIGRRLRGSLSNAHPGYRHSFGESLPELQRIGKQLREIMHDDHAPMRGGGAHPEEADHV